MSRSFVARLAPAAAYQFFFIGAVATLKPGANALTLSKFSPAALPWLYVGAAVLAGALAIIGGSGRKRRDAGFIALVGAAVAGALALGVWRGWPAVALGAYLFAEAFATLVSISFWTAMSEAFDAREARRAFSWINGIGMSGAIVSGLLAQLLAHAFGALALLVAGSGFLLAASVAWRFHHADVEALPPPTTMIEPEKGGWRQVLQTPYTQLMGVFVLGMAMIQQLTDFIFRERAASALSETDMASLFAAHQLWTGVFCVVFQFVLAEVLLRKLGILRYAGLAPGILAFLTLVTWLSPSVWAAWALKVFEAAASWSMLPVAVQLMYAPLPDRLRDNARRTIDGLVRKLGMALAGLLLIGVANLVGVNGVFAAVLLVCGTIGWALWRIRPRYVEAVHARVAGLSSSGRFEGEERLLAQAIQSPAPEQALRAVDLLERTGLLNETHVRTLLEHRQERVQERGVELAERMKLHSAARPLENIIATGARRPRDAAIWALAWLAPERARVVLPPLLGQHDIGMQTAAIGGVLSLPGPEDPVARKLLTVLLQRGADAPPPERREVSRLLGRLAKPELGHALIPYLDDADNSVRRVAIAAVGQGRYAELAPRLLRFLTWRDDRREAREALSGMGDAVVPLLATTLDDRSRSRSLRLHIPRVLRLIATQKSFDALLFSNARDEPALHYRVGLALAHLHDDHPELEVDIPRQLDALRRQRALTEALVEPYRDARAALGETSLLTRVLADRLDQAMEISFWLLGLRHEGSSMRRAHSQLIGADHRRRAWALELVDNVLTADERELVSMMVDANHRALPIGAKDRFARHLQTLCQSDDYVLKACARAIGRRAQVWHQEYREDDMNEQTVKKLFALEGVEIFARSDVDDLAAVAAVAREQSIAKGARVYAEGDPGDALYVIVEGEMQARRDNEVVLSMKAKESFGETSLFDGAPRINEVIAVKDSKVLVIDRRDFLDLLADRPELLSGMFRVLSRQLKSMVVEVTARKTTTNEMQAISAPPVPD